MEIFQQWIWSDRTVWRNTKNIHKSADPGLCQGRGGAWDHRRCGTWLSGHKQRHTPPNASNPPAGLQGNNSYSYSYYFKTAVCSASNPPNASNPPAGLQGNNSYSYYMPLPSGVQDCRLPGLKPPKRFQPSRRPPRQQLLQLLHAPAICFSGGSRLPFARPQTPQTLPQASKATTLTATCPCHLFFRGFTTSLPGLKPSKRFRRLPTQQLLQLHCSYYMPLPSVFQGVQDCRLPALKPPKHAPAIDFIFQGVQDCRLPGFKPSKRFRRLPRQQLLQLHTCPCHLFFRGFKPALTPSKRSRRPPRQQLLQLHAPAICFSGGSRQVCLASNPPNASAGFQGNNSYSYTVATTCPCHLFFRGSRLPFARPQTPQTLPTLPQASKATTLTAIVYSYYLKTAVCPASNPPNASNPPAGLQGNNSYSYYMPLPSVFQGVQDCRLPGLKPPKRFQPSCRPPRQQLLQLLHAPAICFSGGSCPALNPPNPPAGLQGNHSYSYMPLPSILFFTGFKTTVCLASNPPNASAGFQGNNSYSYIHAPAICFSGGSSPPSHPPNASAGFQGNNSYSYSYMPLPSVFPRVQDCRLPGLKPPKRFQPSRRPPRQQLLQLQLHAPAICFSEVQDCRLPGRKPPKRFQPSRRPPRQQLLQLLHAPAICFSGGSRLPFARPQTPQGFPQASQATTLTATCPCHRFYFSRGSRLPFAWPQTLQTLPQASKATALTATTCPCHLFFRGFKPALTPSKRSRRPPRQPLLQLHAPAICFSGGSRQVCLASNPPNASAGFQGNNSYSYTVATTCPCHLFFRGFKTAVCPASNPPNASNPPAGLQGNNSYSYSYYFKTAVCPASNPPNATNPPAGLQGNNSYSYYMPLPSVFQGVQDCRLPGLKPPKPFQPSRRPPRQQLLQLLHALAICFSGGSRLPFARPQTPQTLPQASKATTLTATCPCHLFFRGFTTSLPGLKPSKRFRRLPRQQLLQLHCSYYMPLPSVFQRVQDCRLPGLKPPKRFQPSRRPPRQQLLYNWLLHAPAICFSGGSRLPFARPQTPQTFPQASQATTLTATCPCHRFYFSRGSRLPFAWPQTPQALPTLPQASKATTLIQLLHAPAICFSGGSRLPFARPQTPQTLPQASQATTLTATCPCHRFYFSRGSRLPFAWPQTLQTLPTLPQASKATTLTATCMPLPSVFQGVQARPHTLQTLPQASKATTLTATCPCHLFFRGFTTSLPGLKPSKRFRRLPRQQLLQLHCSYYMPLPSVFQGVQDCRLPGLKPPKRFQPSRRPPRQQLLQLLHAPAICFSGGSRLPCARPQTPQTLPTLPQASKATTLTATTCPCHLFFRGFKTAVCPASNPPNAPNPPALRH